MVEAGHEIASHGWRWIDYQNIPEEVERDHLQRAIDTIEGVCGERPLGWYTGRVSANTRRLVVEEGGFLYDADAYNDDLPFWEAVAGKSHLVVPYTLDVNDMKFGTQQGFNAGDQFFTYLKDAFDVLYQEGERTPKMMSVGLHCRMAGRPGRAAALAIMSAIMTAYGCAAELISHAIGSITTLRARNDEARFWHLDCGFASA